MRRVLGQPLVRSGAAEAAEAVAGVGAEVGVVKTDQPDGEAVVANAKPFLLESVKKCDLQLQMRYPIFAMSPRTNS